MESASNGLGKVLKRLRSERDMSLRELSEYLCISHAYLNKLERGIDSRTGKLITPTIDTLEKISAGLNIPLDKFMDMCGYFEGIYKIKVSEPMYVSKIDIFIELSDIIIALNSTENVEFDKAVLSKQDIEWIETSIKTIVDSLWSKYPKDGKHNPSLK